MLHSCKRSVLVFLQITHRCLSSSSSSSSSSSLRPSSCAAPTASHRGISDAMTSAAEPGLADIGATTPAAQAAGTVPPSGGAGGGPIASILSSLEANSALPHARYVQLATVRPDGRPAVRTVVFRGFLEGSEALQFTTDTRSEKCAHIEAGNGAAELAWYFPATQEQYRVQGTLRLITGAYSEEPSRPEAERALARARRIMWAKMSPSARTSWLWPTPRSARTTAAAAGATSESGGLTPEQEAEEAAVYKPAMPAPSEPVGRYPVSKYGPDTGMDPDSVEATGVPLGTFALLLLEPAEVDHLVLAGFPQRRTIYSRDTTQAPPPPPRRGWLARPVHP